MERAADQEVWEPDTGGCPKLLFPKLVPPCCWRKLPIFDGEVVDPFDDDIVGPPFDAGVAWLEVDFDGTSGNHAAQYPKCYN